MYRVGGLVRLGIAAGTVAAAALGFSSGTAAARLSTIRPGASSSVVRDTAQVSRVLKTWDTAAWQDVEVGDIDPKLFALALKAASAAVGRSDVREPRTLTVIDFSKPSTKKRLWVFDLRSRKLLFEELVSHGRGSGLALATAFSNAPESHQSSLGLFRTGEAYVGKNGYSLRLDGLEPGVNDRARERAIVIHGAPYVSADFAKAQGYLGRSHGCPAVRPEVNRALIDTLKGGSLVFAYYPDSNWLKTSRYLTAA